ncbi:MAG TPA: nuclear transport factor 2 family protein [Candidatus Angelobacter sp.]|nr:nuclear transport factor 2 family protein [Candidatus Angelobacter sp.]
MRKVFSIALVVGLLTFLAANLAGSPDKTADLKKADQDWNQAAQSKNADQFASFLGDDAYACGLDGKWVHGKAAIEDEWKKMLADPSFKLSWTAESVEVSKDGNLGYTRGTFEGSQGNGSFSGSYATVWKKGKDGKWKVAVDIASAAPPQK